MPACTVSLRSGAIAIDVARDARAVQARGGVRDRGRACRKRSCKASREPRGFPRWREPKKDRPVEPKKSDKPWPFPRTSDVFFSSDDFAVNVTWGVQTATGILNAPDETAGGALSREYLLIYPATKLVGLSTGQVLTVDGGAYTVRDVRATDDGKIMNATLSKN